jgi:hypothetical protein
MPKLNKQKHTSSGICTLTKVLAVAISVRIYPVLCSPAAIPLIVAANV